MFKKAVIFLSVLLLSSASAYAEPYLSGNLGFVSAMDSDLTVDGFGTIGEATFDLGVALMAAIGTELAPEVRGEVELAYRSNDVDTVTINGVGNFTGGDISSLSLMANVFKDFPLDDALTPFLGAGLGFANVELDDGFTSEDDTVVAYQLAVGAGYAVSNTLTLEAQYRFFGTSDPDFSGLEAEYMTHNFLFGARVKF